MGNLLAIGLKRAGAPGQENRKNPIAPHERHLFRRLLADQAFAVQAAVQINHDAVGLIAV